MGCGPSNPIGNVRNPGVIKKGAKTIIFHKYDKDRSGKISKQEFSELCMAMGYRLSPQELELALQVLGDGNGNITKEAFGKWWETDKRFVRLQWTPEQLLILEDVKEMFDIYDADKSGKLDLREFKEMHKELVARGITAKPLDEALQQIDKDGDHKIDYQEYIKFMVGTGRNINV